MNDLNKKDDHEEYKKRIRTLVDRLEKGEDLVEDDKPPIDSKSNISKENQISDKEFKVTEDVVLSKEFRVTEDVTLKLEGENFKIFVKNDKNSPFTSLRHLPPRGVIRDIWKYVERSEDQELHEFLDILLFILTEYNFELDPNEIKFLLDWDDEDFEFQFPCYKIHQNLASKQYWESFGIEIFYGSGTEHLNPPPTHWYSYDPTLIRYTDLYYDDESGQQTSVYNGHISGLNLRWVSEIPESIGYLSKLKYLAIINSEELTALPNSFKNLRNLRHLYFYNTGIQSFPDVISSLPKLRRLGLQGIKLDTIPESVKKIAYKYHSRNYVKEGVNRGDANVLGLLEIIAGYPFVPFTKEFEDYDWELTPTWYSTNDIGRVESFCFKDPFRGFPLRYLPEEIQKLEYLGVLKIDVWSPNQVTIPDSLNSFLKSLKSEFLNKMY